jgi:hypothetical protein
MVVGVIRESGLRGWMDADERPGLAKAISQAEAGQYTIVACVGTLVGWPVPSACKSNGSGNSTGSVSRSSAIPNRSQATRFSGR